MHCHREAGRSAHQSALFSSINGSNRILPVKNYESKIEEGFGLTLALTAAVAHATPVRLGDL